MLIDDIDPAHQNFYDSLQGKSISITYMNTPIVREERVIGEQDIIYYYDEDDNLVKMIMNNSQQYQRS